MPDLRAAADRGGGRCDLVSLVCDGDGVSLLEPLEGRGRFNMAASGAEILILRPPGKLPVPLYCRSQGPGCRCVPGLLGLSDCPVRGLTPPKVVAFRKPGRFRGFVKPRPVRRARWTKKQSDSLLGVRRFYARCRHPTSIWVCLSHLSPLRSD